MALKMIGACLIVAAIGYLLGEILFGVLISKVFFHDDVRNHGSGSAGMTNMLRSYGKLAGAATAVGDIGKSFVAVLLGRLVFAAMLPGVDLEPMCGAYLAGIFVVIGHVKPAIFGFKGGKGVLAGAGSALATEPLVCLGLLVVFLIEFAITRIVSLGSIIVAILYPVATLCFWAWKGANMASMLFIGVCSIVMAAMVVYMHRSNITRLRNGTEYRFGEKKKINKD